MKKRNQNVSCYEIQRSIRQYLLGKMTIKEEENFIRHIRSCEECYKELKDYYNFFSALMLDSMEEAEKDSFFMKIEKRLEQTEAKIKKQKADHKKRRFLYIFLAILFAAVMGIRVS